MEETRTCANCGREFTIVLGGSGAKRKYCSNECCRKMPRELRPGRVQRKACEVCGKPISLAAKHYCSIACQHESMRSAQAFTCQQCGKEFHPKAKDRTTFCSRECSFAHMKANARGRAEPQRKPVGQCEFCGEPTLSASSRTCDDPECQKKRSLKSYLAQHPHRAPGTVFVCRECGMEFTIEYGNKHRVYCSTTCRAKYMQKHKTHSPDARARQRHARRARKYSNGPVESISPIDVFRRDGWVCGVCGKKVDRKLKYPDLMSASLDHIVPLARGGTHTLSNVQCAHFICNSHKGDKGNGQLRLGLNTTVPGDR